MSDINKTPKRNVSVRDKIKIADSYISKIIAERESYIKTCMSEKKVYNPEVPKYELPFEILDVDPSSLHEQEKYLYTDLYKMLDIRSQLKKYRKWQHRFNKRILECVAELENREEYRDYIRWSKLEREKISLQFEIGRKQQELDELMGILRKVEEEQTDCSFGISEKSGLNK